MIVEHQGKYKVMNKEGTKVLGVHKTYREALLQLRAIEAAKHSRST